MGLRPLAGWDCGFVPRRGHRSLSLVGVVRHQVEVSATGRSLVQRNPTECVCVRACVRERVSECDRETSQGWPRPTTAVEPWNIYIYEVAELTDFIKMIQRDTIIPNKQYYSFY